MLGESYPIPEKHIESVSSAFKAMEGHKAAMNHHSECLRDIEESVWNTINKIIPEVDMEKYIYGYIKHKNHIKCARLNNLGM